MCRLVTSRALHVNKHVHEQQQQRMLKKRRERQAQRPNKREGKGVEGGRGRDGERRACLSGSFFWPFFHSCMRHVHMYACCLVSRQTTLAYSRSFFLLVSRFALFLFTVHILLRHPFSISLPPSQPFPFLLSLSLRGFPFRATSLLFSLLTFLVLPLAMPEG